MTTTQLAQMLCSRLCHDLITPIGAINTSFELFDESDAEGRLQLLELAQQSAEKAIRKLVFYRAAFGYSTDTHFASVDHTQKLLQDFLNLHKIELLWKKESLTNQSLDSSVENFSAYAQIIANLVFICAEIAPSGGQLEIEILKENSYAIHLKLKGNLVPLRPLILNALKGQLSEEETSPHVIQAIYTRMLCEKLHLDLEIHHQERTALVFIFKIGV